ASPRQEGETAGVEWYDSGIGFAIPLEDINATLPRLREGKDLRRGLLGITMQGGEQAPATVATIAPESAAQKAGLKPGDTIVEINGQKIELQSQLMHMLGGKYEGDKIAITVKRGGETIKLDNIKLAGTLTSFPHPFLGILPLRDDPEPGEEVRYVYPDSPAAKAGIKEGDRIMKIGVTPAPPAAFTGRDQLIGRLNTLPPGTEVKVDVQRKGADKKVETLTIKLAALPETIPDKLPEIATTKRALEPLKPAGGQPKAQPKDAKDQPKDKPKEEEKKDDKKKPETGLLKRHNPGRDHEYWAYVPEKYDPNVSHALLLWLHPVGKGKDKD